MPTKTINLTLDPAEYAFAKKRKGSRTWRQVLLDGVEFKAYTPVVKKHKTRKPDDKKRT